MASEDPCAYSKPLPPPPPLAAKPNRPPPPPAAPKPSLRGAARGRGGPPPRPALHGSTSLLHSPNPGTPIPPHQGRAVSADAPPPRGIPPTRGRAPTSFPSAAPPPRGEPPRVLPPRPAGSSPAATVVPAAAIEPHKAKRTYIVEDILETEKTYVNGVEGLLKEFDKPLAWVLKPEETRTIFSNIHALLGMHRGLLQDLTDRISSWSEGQVIGDVLAKLIPFLKMYSTYINAFDTTNDLIEKLKKKNNDFRLLLPTCKHGINEGELGLSSLLLTPIQRVPRYVLLLKDLLRNTEATHPDFENLTRACDAMTSIATEINERKRKDEQSKRIANLSTELSKALHNSPHDWFRHKTERELPCDECKKVIVSGKKCYSCQVCGQNTH